MYPLQPIRGTTSETHHACATDAHARHSHHLQCARQMRHDYGEINCAHGCQLSALQLFLLSSCARFRVALATRICACNSPSLTVGDAFATLAARESASKRTMAPSVAADIAKHRARLAKTSFLNMAPPDAWPTLELRCCQALPVAAVLALPVAAVLGRQAEVEAMR